MSENCKISSSHTFGQVNITYSIESTLKFATVKKIHVYCFFVCYFLFLHFSKAQQIRFLDKDKHPIDGLIVSLEEMTSRRDQVLTTGNNGIIAFKEITFPLVIQTYHFAFRTFIDTLYKPENKTITLNANSVILKEVSVTGNYGPTDHSLYNTEIISSDNIKSQAANNVQDLFQHQLNARISNDAATGSSVSFQGIGGENIKVLVDGVPVIGRLYNNINLSQLNLNNVSRVEIIKGPASVLYGTNALGGVINIITQTGGSELLKAGINSFYESNGQYNTNVFTNVNSKKSGISITGGRNFFDGWSEKDTSRFQEWKPKEQYFGNIRFSQQFKNSKLTIQSSLFDEKVTAKSGRIRGWPYEAYALDEYYKTKRFNNEFQLNQIVDKTHSLEVTSAYSYYRYIRNTYIKNFLDLSQSLSTNSSQNDTTKFGAGMMRIVYTKNDDLSKLNYQAGIDANSEYTTGERIKNNKQSFGDYAAFVSLQFKPLNALTISPAVRIAYNTTYSAPILPSLQTLYILNSSVSFRASYSRGFRSPSLKEMYLQFVDANHSVFGNTTLHPENSHHFLASVEYKRSLGKTNLQFTTSGFYNFIHEKINLVAQDTGYIYMNLQKYITRGGQMVVKLQRDNIQFSTGVSYTGIYNELANNSITVPFTYSTDVNTSLEYSLQKTNTSVAVYWKYNGKQPVYILDDNNLVHLFHGAAYSMIDLSVMQPFFHNRLSIGAGLKNILNVTTIQNYQVAGVHQSSNEVMLAGMGRSVFLRMQLQLSK